MLSLLQFSFFLIYTFLKKKEKKKSKPQPLNWQAQHNLIPQLTSHCYIYIAQLSSILSLFIPDFILSLVPNLDIILKLNSINPYTIHSAPWPAPTYLIFKSASLLKLLNIRFLYPTGLVFNFDLRVVVFPLSIVVMGTG